MKPEHSQSVFLYMTKYIIFLLLGLAIFGGCSSNTSPSTNTQIDPQYSKNVSTLYGHGKEIVEDAHGNKFMSDITWKDSTGATHSLLELKGSVILLNFWTTWCTYCNEESAALSEISDSLKDQGVRVIGVSIDVGDNIFSRVQHYVNSRNIRYQIVIDPVGYTYLNYGCSATFPWSFIIDSDGYIRYIYEGFDVSATKRDYYEKIQSLL